MYLCYPCFVEHDCMNTFLYGLFNLWYVSGPETQKVYLNTELCSCWNAGRREEERTKLMTWVKEHLIAASSLQAHGITKVGRDFWSSASPTWCSLQGQLWGQTVLSRGCMHLDLENLQGQRLHNLWAISPAAEFQHSIWRHNFYKYLF